MILSKKIKVIISSVTLLVLVFILAIPVLAQSKTDSFMSAWGNILKGYAKNDKIQEQGIYAKGVSATITEEEVQQATDFYLLSGDISKQEAREKAISYSEEREALYEVAILNGYSVTDDEIWSYLKELKEIINTADNKDDLYAIMNSFDSEQEYWDYQFEVYQKNLPIQKYVEDLKAQYESQTGKIRGTLEFMNDFNSYYEKYKQNLVKKENYQLAE
jgi:hypothetical protein